MAEGNRDWKGVPRMGDPDAVDEVEMLDMLRRGLRDDQGNVGAATALVITQLCQPAIAPGFGPFGLPKDDDGGLSDRAVDLRHNVGAELALSDGLDEIGRKTSTQQHLKLELKYLAL